MSSAMIAPGFFDPFIPLKLFLPWPSHKYWAPRRFAIFLWMSYTKCYQIAQIAGPLSLLRLHSTDGCISVPCPWYPEDSDDWRTLVADRSPKDVGREPCSHNKDALIVPCQDTEQIAYSDELNLLLRRQHLNRISPDNRVEVKVLLENFAATSINELLK